MRHLQGSDRITPEHRARKAVVYMRQSSMRQVRENQESQRMQRALADVAREEGWSQVETIDCDLGVTASMAGPRRDGFESLIGAVALGEVGLILSSEVSRLSRTDKDWCQLFEVCQVFDTLIGDADRIYDLSSIDDQMVLGIKGTLSVVELKIIKRRLVQGQEEKARRGELYKLLPPGYVLSGEGHVVKDPDLRIREAIQLIFARFRDLGTGRQTFLWFHEEGVKLPVNRPGGGRTKVVWKLPSMSFIYGVLRNPFYAGAYVYGRRVRETKLREGRLVIRQSAQRPAEECRVFLRDHHEGYIDWDRFESIQRQLSENCQKYDLEGAVSAIRSGQCLLAGLLRCGHCGRKLHAQYSGRRNTTPRYLCKGDYEQGGDYCLSLAGRPMEQRFTEELLAVISPLGVEASLVALEQFDQEAGDRSRAQERQLEQLEYEAQRAFEQYDEVDPRHRLVASELERRWNEKLAEVEQLRAAVNASRREAPALTPEDEDRILRLGERFHQAWHDPACPIEEKKRIVRAVVEEVIASHDEATETLRFVVHWKGGAHTAFEVPKPRHHPHKTAEEPLEIIRKMAPRYGDDAISAVLNKLGHRTGKGLRWKGHRVTTTRYRYGIEGKRWRDPDPEVFSLTRAAKHCGVSEGTIRRLVASGLLEKQQIVLYAPWEIRRADLDAEPIRSLVERCRASGRLDLEGVIGAKQKRLFP